MDGSRSKSCCRKVPRYRDAAPEQNRPIALEAKLREGGPWTERGGPPLLPTSLLDHERSSGARTSACDLYAAGVSRGLPIGPDWAHCCDLAPSKAAQRAAILRLKRLDNVLMKLSRIAQDELSAAESIMEGAARCTRHSF